MICIIYAYVCTSPTCGKLSRENGIVKNEHNNSLSLSRALGHAANRGKVYLLHPELFKVR